MHSAFLRPTVIWLNESLGTNMPDVDGYIWHITKTNTICRFLFCFYDIFSHLQRACMFIKISLFIILENFCELKNFIFFLEDRDYTVL